MSNVKGQAIKNISSFYMSKVLCLTVSELYGEEQLWPQQQQTHQRVSMCPETLPGLKGNN